MYARCKNSLEGYSCECLTGFEGDGETCTCALDYISIILRRASNVAGFFKFTLCLKRGYHGKKGFDYWHFMNVRSSTLHRNLADCSLSYTFPRNQTQVLTINCISILLWVLYSVCGIMKFREWSPRNSIISCEGCKHYALITMQLGYAGRVYLLQHKI